MSSSLRNQKEFLPIPKTAPPEFPLFAAEVGDKRRLALPGDAIKRVQWAKDLKAADPATFEKMPGGCARLRLGSAYDEAIAAAGDSAPALAAVAALMVKTKWERAQRITVPAVIAWHLFGPNVIRGSVYVHAATEWFELWSERFYDAWVQRMRDDLPD